MGLISAIKALFNKNIDCGLELDGYVLYKCITKGGNLYNGANIVVRDGFEAVFVCKNKVCDVLTAGKYKISPSTLPNTFSRAGASRLLEHGVSVKKIKSSVYFVNTKVFPNLPFRSNNSLTIKSVKFGKVKFKISGLYGLQVIDSVEFIKFAMSKLSIKKPDKFTASLGAWIGNKSIYALSHSKYAFTDMLARRKEINNYIHLNIVEDVSKHGMRLINERVEDYIVDKDVEQAVNSYLNTVTIDKDLVAPVMINSVQYKVSGGAYEEHYEHVNGLNVDKVCPRCGHVIDDGTYCPYCGTKL